MEEIHTEWIVLKAEIIDDGKLLEVQFQHRYDKRQRMATRLTADHWLTSTWADFKLEDFRKALRKATNILDGKQ